MSDGTYTPQPFTLNGKATHAQAAEYYREEYLRIVGEATTLKSVINQQAFDIEILRERVARLEAGDLTSPVRKDEYVGTYLTKGAVPQYTYNVDPRKVVTRWEDGKIVEVHELPEGTACSVKRVEVMVPTGMLTQDEIAQYEGATCRH